MKVRGERRGGCIFAVCRMALVFQLKRKAMLL